MKRPGLTTWGEWVATEAAGRRCRCGAGLVDSDDGEEWSGFDDDGVICDGETAYLRCAVAEEAKARIIAQAESDGASEAEFDAEWENLDRSHDEVAIHRLTHRPAYRAGEVGWGVSWEPI